MEEKEEIKVGTYVTEYLYTDRIAYQVVAVKDSKHFTMKGVQNNVTIDVAKRGNQYFHEVAISKTKLHERAEKVHEALGCSVEDAYKYLVFMANLTDSQLKRFEEGKEVKEYNKLDLVIGVNDPYFDPNF